MASFRKLGVMCFIVWSFCVSVYHVKLNIACCSLCWHSWFQSFYFLLCMRAQNSIHSLVHSVNALIASSAALFIIAPGKFACYRFNIFKLPPLVPVENWERKQRKAPCATFSCFWRSIIAVKTAAHSVFSGNPLWSATSSQT